MSDLLPRERRALGVRALLFASVLAVACGGRSIRHYEETGGAAGEGAAGGSGGTKPGTGGKGSGGSGPNPSGGTSTSGGAAGSVGTGATGGSAAAGGSLAAGGSVSVGGGPSSGGISGTAGVSTPGGSAGSGGTGGVGGSVNMAPTFCDPGVLAAGVKCDPGSVSILEVKDCYLLMGCTLGDACGQSGLECDACVGAAIPPEELQGLCVPAAAVGFLPATCAQFTASEYPACMR